MSTAAGTPSLDAEAVLAILRQQGLRAETTINAESREDLECEHIRLESSFVEAKPLPYWVFVHRIDLDSQRLPERSENIVKFSQQRFSPATYGSLQLGTPPYYRGYEGVASGIRDPDDAAYEESLGSYFGRYNPEALPMLGTWSERFTIGETNLTYEATAAGSVTYEVNDRWLYCAALRPRSPSERAVMQSQLDGDCMTALGEPSTFARELGSAFAQLSPGPRVSLDEWFSRVKHEMLQSQTPFKQFVHVYHGPVVYTDHAENLIEAVPLEYRAAAVPFVKRTDYATQREYRFAVTTIGTPTENRLAVPITTQLRSLSEIVD